MKKFAQIASSTAAVIFGVFISTVLLTTATRAQTVIPHFECTEPVYTDGAVTQLKAWFGYTNTTNAQITVTSGPNNFFSPNPGGQINQQTTVFLPGYRTKTFFIMVSPSTPINWIVQNQAARTINDWSAFCGVGAINYQGRLSVSGAAANQPHDFEFRFFDTETGGTERQPRIQLTNVPVTNGVFTVLLDILPYIRNHGFVKYLQISVRQGGTQNEFVQLSPRQQITAVPYAINAANAANAINAENATNAVTAKNVSGGSIKVPIFQIAPSPFRCDSDAERGLLEIFNDSSGNQRLYVCTTLGWRGVAFN